MKAYLTERSFAIIDELVRIGTKHRAAPASVALAWLLNKAGVSSIIIGARRLEQLDQNLAAFDVALDADDMQELDAASVPTLNFPAAMLRGANMVMHGGATVNGEPSVPWPMAPKSAAERY